MILSKLNKNWVSERLPLRPENANKGTFGRVLVIAGSENFPGAAYLSCSAVYRVGAGLVTLVTNEITKIIVSRQLPELTFLSREEVLKKIGEYDVLLVGPGLGKSNQTMELMKQLLNNILPPTVIDGDGLNILSKTERWWERIKREVVLTPHPGEMGRLTGLTVDKIQFNREEIALQFAKKWNKILVLKGANTVIASPAGEVKISHFANPALATAGTGDVLAGIIAGLVAQGVNLFDASCVGVYLHGLAGEKAKGNIGLAGVIASDLLSLLPQVIKELI